MNVTGIDTTPPIVDLIKTAGTTNTLSFSSTSSDPESGITKYEFRINSGAWVDKGTTNTHTFTSVTSGNKTIDVRVTNGSGLTSTKTLTAAPETIIIPTYSVSPTGWATSKTITITYPTRQTGFVYQYQVNGGTWTTVSSGTSQSLTFTENGTIVARISDGTNTVNGTTLNVTGIDTTPPLLTVSRTDATTNTMTVTSTASDPESGIIKYEFKLDDGAWVNKATTNTHTFTSVTSGNKVVYARVTNGSGLMTTVNITTNPESIIVPTYSVSPTGWATSKTVTVNYPTRQSSFVYQYQVNGGTWTTLTSGTSQSLTFTENGTIVARISDGINTVNGATLNVTGIDTTDPTATISKTGGTTNTIIVKSTASDPESGIIKYEFRIASGAWVDKGTTDSHTFTSVTSGNKTIDVRVTNGAGRTYIASVTTSTTTIALPTYSVSPTGWATSKDVVITYPARQTGFVYQYQVNGGTWTTVTSGTSQSLTFTENGNVIARISDGTNTVNGATLNVTGIDTTEPIVGLSKTSGTTNTIGVTATASDPESGITKYEFRINSGTWVDKGTSNTHTFTSVTSGNKTIEVRVTNGSGLITNRTIEVLIETIIVPTYSASPTGWATSKNVVITYPTRQTGFVYQYQVNGGSWITVTTGVTETVMFTANGNIVARVSDGTNTVSGTTLNVTGIDTSAPIVSLSKTSGTTNTIGVTATASDPESGITKYEFRINSGSWVDKGTTNNHTFTSVTSGNKTIEVRVTNGSGLTVIESLSTNPNPITVPTYSVSPTGWATSKNVVITYPTRQTGFVYQYQVNGGSWITVTSGVTETVMFTANGTIVARVNDGTNIVNGTTLNVTGIDSSVPTVILNKTSGTTNTIGVTATASDPESGITKYEFRINSGAWVDKGTTNTHTFTSVTSGNKTIEVRVTNGSGLTTNRTIEESTETIPVPTYSATPTGWATSKNVVITYPTRQTGFVYQYQVNGGTWTTVSSGTSQSLTFTANGTVVARISDGTNTVNGATLNITGIDASDVTLSIQSVSKTTSSITSTVSISVGASGIGKVEYKLNNGSWISNGTSATITLNELTHNTLYNFTVKVTNGAGTFKEISGSSTTNQITIPTYSVTPAGWAQSKTATITFPTRQTGFVYQYQKDGGAWTTVSSGTTQSLTFTANGTIVARITDGTNTVSATTLNVTQIDTTPPTCGTITGASTTWTNSNRTISVACSDTGGSGCTASSSSSTFSTGVVTTSTITIFDNVGNSRSCPINVYVDKTAPTCVSSGGSTTWTNGSRTITGTCSDVGSGCVGNVSTNHTAQINTTTASPGTVSDNAGNYTVCPANETVRIDKTAPTASLQFRQVTGNAVYTPGNWSSSLLYVSALNSTDSGGSGIKDQYYTLINTNRTLPNPSRDTCNGSTCGGYIIIGTWSTTVTAIDNAGNSSTTAYSNLRVDPNGPSLTITSVSSPSNGALRIVISLSTNGPSGINLSNTKYFVTTSSSVVTAMENNANHTNWNSATSLTVVGTNTINLTGLSAGNYYVVAKATSGAGLVFSHTSGSVQVKTGS